MNRKTTKKLVLVKQSVRTLQVEGKGKNDREQAPPSC